MNRYEVIEKYKHILFKEYHIVNINNKEVDKYRTLIEILFFLEGNSNIKMYVEGTIKEFNFSTIRKYIKEEIKRYN